MRAIVIDALKREVREEQISGDLESLQKAVGGMIELVYIDDEHDMFVNEEGLINGTQEFFTYHGGHQPFAGSAVIVRHNAEGETTAATMSLADVIERVSFLTRAEALEVL